MLSFPNISPLSLPFPLFIKLLPLPFSFPFLPLPFSLSFLFPSSTFIYFFHIYYCVFFSISSSSFSSSSSSCLSTLRPFWIFSYFSSLPHSLFFLLLLFSFFLSFMSIYAKAVLNLLFFVFSSLCLGASIVTQVRAFHVSKRWRKKIFLRKAKKFFLSPIRGKYLYVHTHTRTHAHTLIPPPPLPLSSFISLNTKMFHTIRLHIFLLFLLESNAFIPFLSFFRYPSGLIRSPERGLSRLFSFLIFFPFFHFSC